MLIACRVDYKNAEYILDLNWGWFATRKELSVKSKEAGSDSLLSISLFKGEVILLNEANLR